LVKEHEGAVDDREDHENKVEQEVEEAAPEPEAHLSERDLLTLEVRYAVSVLNDRHFNGCDDVEHNILHKCEHDICGILEGDKWRQGYIYNDPERGEHPDHLTMDKLRAAKDVDEVRVPLFVTKAVACAADRHATAVAVVDLTFIVVEPVEAGSTGNHLRRVHLICQVLVIDSVYLVQCGGRSEARVDEKKRLLLLL